MSDLYQYQSKEEILRLIHSYLADNGYSGAADNLPIKSNTYFPSFFKALVPKISQGDFGSCAELINSDVSSDIPRPILDYIQFEISTHKYLILLSDSYSNDSSSINASATEALMLLRNSVFKYAEKLDAIGFLPENAPQFVQKSPLVEEEEEVESELDSQNNSNSILIQNKNKPKNKTALSHKSTVHFQLKTQFLSTFLTCRSKEALSSSIESFNGVPMQNLPFPKYSLGEFSSPASFAILASHIMTSLFHLSSSSTTSKRLPQIIHEARLFEESQFLTYNPINSQCFPSILKPLQCQPGYSLPSIPLVKLSGHSDAVTNVQFSPNGECLAASSTDGTVSIWNINLKSSSSSDSVSDSLPIPSISAKIKTQSQSDNTTTLLGNGFSQSKYHASLVSTETHGPRSLAEKIPLVATSESYSDSPHPLESLGPFNTIPSLIAELPVYDSMNDNQEPTSRREIKRSIYSGTSDIPNLISWHPTTPNSLLIAGNGPLISLWTFNPTSAKKTPTGSLLSIFSVESLVFVPSQLPPPLNHNSFGGLSQLTDTSSSSGSFTHSPQSHLLEHQSGSVQFSLSGSGAPETLPLVQAQNQTSRSGTGSSSSSGSSSSRRRVSRSSRTTSTRSTRSRSDSDSPSNHDSDDDDDDDDGTTASSSKPDPHSEKSPVLKRVTGLSWLKTGKRFICCGTFQWSILVCDIDQGRVIHKWKGLPCISMTFCPDLNYAFFLTVGGRIRIIDLNLFCELPYIATGFFPHSISMPKESLPEITVPPQFRLSHSMLLLSGRKQNILIDWRRRKIVTKYDIENSKSHHIQSAFGGYKSRFLVSGSPRGQAIIWHWSGQILKLLNNNHTDIIPMGTWHPKFNQLIATCSHDSSIIIYVSKESIDCI